MAPAAGDRLAQYEVVAPLGAGGMGEVYRARDTRLGREVALKILPESVAGDPERLARFEREARTLASVNHPNIAVLYGLETSSETTPVFLAMELVEGTDLAQRIANGPLTIDETIALGTQIAAGLEAAHLKGIIHRDLKPANIRITHDGIVKILDFGLAKEGAPQPDDADYTASPTVTADMTRAGTIMGTAPYLSPEQASGKLVDRRTDIWALGCVLYEMLSGRRAFPGKTSTEIVARVLEREPDWDALPPTVSPALRRLLERCLAKHPQQRLRDAGDVALALEDLANGGDAPDPAAERPRSTTGLRVAFGLASMIAAILAVLLWTGRSVSQHGELEGPVRFTETSPAALDIARIGHMGSAVAISPDGHVLVWVGLDGDATQLYSRHLDEPQARPVEGTEGALAPFFSPDGEWIGFWADKKLKKIAVRGGVPQTICDVDHIHGASWGEGVIAMENGGGGFLAMVDPGGSDIEEIQISGSRGQLAAFPKVLPGSKTALVSSLDGSHVGCLALDTGEITPLLEDGSNASYVPSGHLVWISGNSLLAAPFDLENLEITGESHTVVEDVLVESGFAGHYAVSDGGTLVYLPGTALAGAAQPSWLDFDGSTEPLPLPSEHSFLSPRISPTGRNVIVTRTTELQNVWLVDLERETNDPVTAGDGNQYWAVWTPDGDSVIFNWLLGSDLELWLQPIDRSRAPEQLSHEPGLLHVPMDITPDGTTVLLGVAESLNSRMALHTLELGAGGKSRPLLAPDANVIQAKISPDGRFLAYTSDRTDRYEVYVQPYPDVGSTVRVSPNGGQEPLWSPSGDRLYYRSLNGSRIFAVDLLERDPLRLGKEGLVIEGHFLPGIKWGRTWDIDPDGKRFLVLAVKPSEPPEGIRVVRNWFTELEQLVPTGKR